jgi:hypothetical protein
VNGGRRAWRARGRASARSRFPHARRLAFGWTRSGLGIDGPVRCDGCEAELAPPRVVLWGLDGLFVACGLACARRIEATTDHQEIEA